ncbi:FimV/HubP family polar landmark protein [Paraburkholderia sp. 31.1]|uniref:FimV/HubP family polar landmark protein n=1 Tax=Paraburkholderia sp. 31.1 TaxID=2615205 RepID=UPI001656552C|nr:FimV/HubP family polar landmark protein [Paraburkholderia sp. 31.1]
MNFRRSALRAMSIRHEKVRFSSRPAAMAACATFALALLGGGAGNALAAPASATSAPDAASAVSSTTAVVAVAAGSQYTVHAGQSLNDVAIAITQSHDRAVLARATHALFDTNPAAFMNHDPSRMRVGAVLIVPALDASGALAVLSTGAAAGASESTAAAPASAPTAAQAAASTASAVAQVNAAAASAASAAAQATTPAASTVSGAASAAVSTGAAAGGAVSSAPVAGSAPVATSGTREWAGSIQPAASAPAGQAPAAATAAAQAASQPHPQVSSLQQLLALKNRVLMELQKHGIGGAPVASGPTPTSAAQPAPAGSAATVAVAPEHANVTTSPSNEGGISQRDLSIAAAVGAALIVLLAALRMGRHKRDNEAAARAAQATDAEIARSAREADSRNGSAAEGQAAVTEGSDAQDQEVARQAVAAEHAAAERAAAEQAAAESAAAERAAAEQAAAESAAVERAAAEQAAAESAAAEQTAAERAAAERAAAGEHAAAERAAAEQAAAEQAAAEQAAAEQAAAEQAAARVAAEHAEAERIAAERIAAERSAPERAAEEQAAQQADTPEPTALTAPLASIPLPSQSELSSEPPAVAPAHDETLRSAATAANLAAAAELGADALPLGPLEPVGAATQDENAHRLQWDEEPTESPTAEKTTGTTTTPSPSAAEPPSTASHTATAEPQSPLNVPPPVIDFTQHQIEPRATTSFGQPFSDIPVPTEPALSAPTEFPREAVDAFGSLNMPLPPRIDVPTVGEAEPSTSLSTQPVASPDTTAQQAFGVHGADDDAPHIADQIAAGTAGHGAVAGLGAAGFGALKLDFDLELPPSPAQPLPAFTPADLGRIARNKLELASEYIELGDLAGARALINEVIEANDPATRTEARALLSTLAPLS